MEDSTGVCAQNKIGWVDWEWPNNNEQKSLGYYLDTFSSSGMISPAMTGTSYCVINSATKWKDTTSVRAWKSTGSITVYYRGTKQLFYTLMSKL